jgi:hypothetical protein
LEKLLLGCHLQLEAELFASSGDDEEVPEMAAPRVAVKIVHGFVRFEVFTWYFFSACVSC